MSKPSQSKKINKKNIERKENNFTAKFKHYFLRKDPINQKINDLKLYIGHGIRISQFMILLISLQQEN
jgi:hypothetical protein